MRDVPPVPGTQVVHRVATLLRAIGGAQFPTDTSALAAQTGMSRPTIHRILTALAAEGLLEREPATGDWHLGPELFVLGAVAAQRYPLQQSALPSLRRLSTATGESAFLSVRRGDEVVCVAEVEGSFPVRSHVLYEGIRLPLGVASAGLAILAHLPDAEVTQVLASTRAQRGELGPQHSDENVLGLIAAARRTGYAVNPGLIIEGSWGLAAAVFNSLGQPQYALTLTGIETRFTGARQATLGRALLDEAHRLTRTLDGRH